VLECYVIAIWSRDNRRSPFRDETWLEDEQTRSGLIDGCGVAVTKLCVTVLCPNYTHPLSPGQVPRRQAKRPSKPRILLFCQDGRNPKHLFSIRFIASRSSTNPQSPSLPSFLSPLVSLSTLLWPAMLGLPLLLLALTPLASASPTPLPDAESPLALDLSYRHARRSVGPGNDADSLRTFARNAADSLLAKYGV
jgi:hypothetical protein